jgi:glycosyltransferase involved in cell wall biosynthesis
MILANRRPGLPRISVIIPAYNRAGMISRAIDSVLAQDFHDFELIVVDDGSTDETVEVARGFDDPRVRVVALGRNRGSNAARNAGIKNALAPLVAFLDSDDTYLPHKLSTVVAEFDRDPELEVLVDSFVKLTAPNARRDRIERLNPRITSNAEFARRLFARELWKPTSAITVKREAAIRAGMFDEGVGRRQDFEFLIRLTEVAKCASTDAITWTKYWTPDSISERKAFVASTLDLVRRHPQYLARPEYRCGLAKDLARHLLMLLRQRRYGEATTGVRLLLREFGAARTAGLLVGGARELSKRRLKRRRASTEPSVEEPSAARNRASARS